jgi:hypothetical protein
MHLGLNCKLEILIITFLFVSLTIIYLTSGLCNAENGIIEGATLYENICSPCHYSLEESSKAGRRFSRIKSSLKRLSYHETVPYLRDEELEAIADVLNEVAY